MKILVKIYLLLNTPDYETTQVLGFSYDKNILVATQQKIANHFNSSIAEIEQWYPIVSIESIPSNINIVELLDRPYK